MIGPETVLRRAEDVRYRVVQQEGVVVRQRSAEAIVVSEVGARLLDLIDGRRPVAELLTLLGREYEVTRPVLEADVLAYLEEIAAIGLVEPVET